MGLSQWARTSRLTAGAAAVWVSTLLVAHPSGRVLAAATGVGAATACRSLVGVAFGAATVTAAEDRGAGRFRGDGMAAPADVPAFCRAVGHIRPEPGSDIGFEVWLPRAWNGRLNGAGNGGFSGAIAYSPGLVQAVQGGQVGISTDTGHSSGPEDAAWARDRPQRVRDYGWRAIHLSAVAAKAIAERYYGRRVEHAYFTSCSNGGREALMEAQRFPADYDGISAGAPAYDWTGAAAAMLWDVRAQMAKGAAIRADQAGLLQAVVLDTCDAADGVKDGLVSDPLACHIDIGRLLCANTSASGCFTPAQGVALAKIYQGPHDSAGRPIYPGFPASGAERSATPDNGWNGWIFAPPGGVAHDVRYPAGLLEDFDPELGVSLATFDFDRDPERLRTRLGPQINATDPDLRAFFRHGGKLILWHGWADQALPPGATLDYYRQVREAVGATAASRSLRLFMVPGVRHCLGGPGLNSFGQFAAPGSAASPSTHLVSALQAWVERGRAPDVIVGRHLDRELEGAFDPFSGAPTRTGLICAYPAVAAVRPGGDPRSAADMSCRAPAGP